MKAPSTSTVLVLVLKKIVSAHFLPSGVCVCTCGSKRVQQKAHTFCTHREEPSSLYTVTVVDPNRLVNLSKGQPS